MEPKVGLSCMGVIFTITNLILYKKIIQIKVSKWYKQTYINLLCTMRRGIKNQGVWFIEDNFNINHYYFSNTINPFVKFKNKLFDFWNFFICQLTFYLIHCFTHYFNFLHLVIVRKIIIYLISWSYMTWFE